MTKGPKSKQVTLIALAAIVLLMVPCFGVAFSGQGGESAIGIVFVLMGLILLLALVAAVSGLTWLLRARRNTFGTQLGLSSDEPKDGPKEAGK